MHYEDRSFQAGELGARVTGARFLRCRFPRDLPDFDECDFHDCSLAGARIGQLTRSRLWRCDLSGADFRRADVRGSQTHPHSPSRADGCQWAGLTATIDCRFFGGLTLTDADVYTFLTLALVPESPLRPTLYAQIPERFRPQVRALLGREYRPHERLEP